MPKVVIGTIIAVATYTIIFLLAYFNEGATLQLPGETIYPLLAYALIGCLGMVVVLPLLILKNK